MTEAKTWRERIPETTSLRAQGEYWLLWPHSNGGKNNMGQAFRVVNLDKKQYLRPHAFDDGYKILELHRCLTALAILCSNDGDHPWRDAPGHGTWCGDKIAVVGEYSDLYERLEEEGYVEVGSSLASYLRRVYGEDGDE